ncbi:MAG: outer membrane protein assembly factor BamA [Gammaproteobacteria bacterium]|nr:outer membrane protein assembly factor BamA [Gammaproteobacteria bacterium]
MSFFRRGFLLFLFGCASLPVQAETFRVQDIQIEGLERIEAGTVFTYLPVKVGDMVDVDQTAPIVRELYKTGLFRDIALRREGDILVVVVQERPGIASITFDGNRIMNDEQLTEVLVDIGIASGHVFNRSVLERLENELLQQYFAFGKYNVEIDTQVVELPRNRVGISIQIVEGEVARIKQVKIVGNASFDQEALTEDFESGLKSWYQFFGTRDRYAKAKLQGDLERLRAHYLNHGYLKFNIKSTQVSLSPDKEDIFITVNVEEGDQYTLKEVELAGDMVLPEEELKELIRFTPGETFSRARVSQLTEAILRKLGDHGYAFPNANPVPEINDEDQSVKITIFVDPGKRAYVRRINFRGHKITQDEVYRRELRQMEGGWYSQSNIEASRLRLQRLSFVESVEFQTLRVPGVDDLVDLDIEIKERLSGSFNVGAGYSDSQGAVLSTSVSQENFLGTGKTVSFSINTSKVNTVYALNYVNPYHTIDGVSRGFGFNYVSTEADEADISDFDTDQFGVNISYGMPLTENNRINALAQLARTEITTGSNTPREIFDFIENNDDEYLNLTLSSNFIHDTRDRRLFPNVGNRQRAGVEFTLPGSDLEFYKLNYSNTFYFPLGETFILSLGSEFGYGDAYGSSEDLPFFEKFRAGGVRTVRGYESNSLGPRDSLGEPYGGNLLTTFRSELLFPPPPLPLISPGSARMSLFVDAGNVFEEVDDFETGDLRGAVGLGVNLITGFGGISVVFATPFNDQSGDEKESFQFNLGTSF